MTNDTRYFTLTSSVGDFVFPNTTIRSHAKLIRDTVAGIINMGGGGTHTEKIPRNPGLISQWVRDNMDGPVSKAGIVLEWFPSSGRR